MSRHGKAVKVRRHQPRVSLAVWGLIAVVGVIAAVAFAFTGPSAFKGQGFQLNAVFTSDSQLGISSAVRVAGVPVGSVVSERPLAPGSDAILATMRIAQNGLPLHTDATAKIRPRLLLEGNFYVDLSPGSPEAPILRSGGTLPASQTSGPVQLDRVLSSLNLDTRTDLQLLLQGLGSALGGRGGTGDAVEDPRTRGQTAGQSLHDSLTYSPAALQDLALTSSALQGERANDLSRLVSGSSRMYGALASEQTHLSGLIAHFNTTLGAFAAEQRSLGQTVAALPGFLSQTDTTDSSLDASIPATRAFARNLQPGLRALPATITAGTPWIAQSSLLLARNDLGGLASSLAPAFRDTAMAISVARPLVSALDEFDRCGIHNLLPAGDEHISDPPLQSAGSVFAQGLQGIVGIVSASQNFDGNGYYIRGQTSGGAYPVLTSSVPSQGPLRGNALLPPLGTRPAWPGKQPPLISTVPCADSAPPDLNAAKTGAGP